MWDLNCFNLHCRGDKCKIFKNIDGCPEKCTGRITDPVAYIERLQSIYIYYKKHNKKEACKNLMNEIDKIKIQYDIDITVDKYEGWEQAYIEDMHRGEKSGGGSKGYGRKPIMNDNRILDTKMNSVERAKVRQAHEEFEQAVKDDEHARDSKDST